jgi:septal ring factor EnvC (AmiA/AmiB activator)
MQSLKNHRRRKPRIWMGQVLLAVLIGIVFVISAPAAEANFFDTIKDIYHLPQDVENLQKQYEDTKQSFEDTKQQVEEQKQQLLAASKKAQETEDRLTQQNKQLQENNDTLQTRLQLMEETVNIKDKWIQRFKAIGITLVSLIILYFALGRLFRVFIWRRNNRSQAGRR